MAQVAIDRFRNVAGKLNYSNDQGAWICCIINKEKGRSTVNQGLDVPKTDGYGLKLPEEQIKICKERAADINTNNKQI